MKLLVQFTELKSTNVLAEPNNFDGARPFQTR